MNNPLINLEGVKFCQYCESDLRGSRWFCTNCKICLCIGCIFGHKCKKVKK